ncbi:MAG: signal peptidase II, partial [Ilumatobacteraceae bacterium]
VSLRREANRWSALGVGLIIGGAVGNLVDRVFRGDGFLNGSVVDFIDFQWFPIFNVADMGINVGGAILVIGYVLRPESSESKSDVSPDDSPRESVVGDD